MRRYLSVFVVCGSPTGQAWDETSSRFAAVTDRLSPWTRSNCRFAFCNRLGNHGCGELQAAVSHAPQSTRLQYSLSVQNPKT